MRILDHLRSRFTRSRPGAPLASVFQLGPRLVIHAHHRSPEGIYVAAEPVFELSADVPPEQIGVAVLGALAAFRSGIVIDTRKPPQLAALQAALGIRSWSALMRDTRVCEVARENDTFEVMPSRHEGSGKFIHVPQHSLRIPAAGGSAALGSAVLTVLSRRDVPPAP